MPGWTGERHERIQFPIGVSLELIDKRRHDGHKAHADHLFLVAEGGKELLYEAIVRADGDDNEEFFVQAYENWGPLVDAVLDECGLEYRDSLTGRARAVHQPHQPNEENR